MNQLKSQQQYSQTVDKLNELKSELKLLQDELRQQQASSTQSKQITTKMLVLLDQIDFYHEKLEFECNRQQEQIEIDYQQKTLQLSRVEVQIEKDFQTNGDTVAGTAIYGPGIVIPHSLLHKIDPTTLNTNTNQQHHQGIFPIEDDNKGPVQKIKKNKKQYPEVETFISNDFSTIDLNPNINTPQKQKRDMIQLDNGETITPHITNKTTTNNTNDENSDNDDEEDLPETTKELLYILHQDYSTMKHLFQENVISGREWKEQFDVVHEKETQVLSLQTQLESSNILFEQTQQVFNETQIQFDDANQKFREFNERFDQREKKLHDDEEKLITQWSTTVDSFTTHMTNTTQRLDNIDTYIDETKAHKAERTKIKQEHERQQKEVERLEREAIELRQRTIDSLPELLELNRKALQPNISYPIQFEFENMPNLQMSCAGWGNVTLDQLFYTSLVKHFLVYYFKPLEDLIRRSKLYISSISILDGDWVQIQGAGTRIDMKQCSLLSFVRAQDALTPFKQCDPNCKSCKGKASNVFTPMMPRTVIRFKWE